MDKDSFIHITGRKKNVIVTKNGKNIYPEEIETLLGRSPYIKESLVYGKEDEALSDVAVAATIVPDMDAIASLTGKTDMEPTGNEVMEIIKNEIKEINKVLVTYKYIRHIQLRDNEFAKTTTKKIKRYMENTGK